jgi:acyl-CoA synthetase (AMP-forming)/AMP-acid ligase II
MPGDLLLQKLSRYRIGTFADIIYRNALLFPNREAYVYGNIRTTFSQYNSRVNRLIHALNNTGIRKGETVGILSLNSSQFADINGAVMKGGFIGSPFNTRLTAGELEYIINYSETRILFLGSEFADMINSTRKLLPEIEQYIVLEDTAQGMVSLEEYIDSESDEEPETIISEDDLMYIIYTSGTTGIPRGALYDHKRLMDDAITFTRIHDFREGDKHLQITPMFHVAGNTWFRTIMLVGLCNVIQKTFNPVETLKIIEKEKITHAMVVPTQFVSMLNLPDFGKYDISSMKEWHYGGSHMPVEVMKRVVSIFGPKITEGYGQSESGPAITHLTSEECDVTGKPEEEQKILLSAGRPHIGVQVRIVDDMDFDVKEGEIGEIIVKSKHVMKEFWKKPEETEKTMLNGWLHTGDMGYYDSKGYIYIADRKKDMIISGGENVYPREVEEVLYKHPCIVEAAVVGIPDDYWVEKVHAILVLKQDTSITQEEITAFCKQHIAGYKTPKSIEIAESLPKNASGKVLKKELRNKYWEGHRKKV